MKNIVFIPYIKREDINVGNGQGKARWDSGYDYEIGVKSTIVNYL